MSENSGNKKVTIHTDGACDGNPGPGGWAAVLRFGEHVRELTGGEPATTNNRMELQAAISALKVLKEPCEVTLFTDSEYAYGVSAAFAWVALRRFREKRLFGAGKAAFGGATLSGIAAATGCFLSGCCGSPMLGVYLSLFGASLLPWAKPLVAGLTTVMIAVSYWWMVRRENQCCEPACWSGGCG